MDNRRVMRQKKLFNSLKWSFWSDRFTTAYSNQEPDFNGGENDAKKGSHARHEVKFINFPYQNCCFIVNQANYSRDDDGRQDSIWSVLEKRGDELQRQEHDYRHHNVRNCCLTASHVVHCRSREWTCTKARNQQWKTNDYDSLSSSSNYHDHLPVAT